MRFTLTIVQTYVPEYRRQFFEELVRTLRTDGVDCRITSSPVQAGLRKGRADSVSAPWIIETPMHVIPLGSRVLNLGGSSESWRTQSGVILSLQGTSVDLYRALAAQRRGLRVGVWGHILPSVKKPNRLDLALERLQMRRADQIFAYTAKGAEYAHSVRGGASGVTVVGNTVDTSGLAAAVDGLEPRDADAFLRDRPTFAYIGSLDAGKGVPFLASVLDELWERDPSVRVLVGGRGDEEALLNRAVSRQQVELLGRVDARQKAMMGQVARAILAPGRIGLVAVDARVLGLPVVAREGELHGPEYEYLTEGANLFTAARDSRAFVDRMLDLPTDKPVSAGPQLPIPQIADMVSNFRDGVNEMLNRP